MFDKFDISNIWQGDGLIISVVGYIVVFIALLILFIFISNLQKILAGSRRKKLRKSGYLESDTEDLSISGEVSAAISMAIYLHYAEAHDFENTILTIDKVKKPYSPWSSKLYGLRQYPSKKGW